MSLVVSQGEDETVITIKLNPKSKWPIWLQFLRRFCYSPEHDMSQDMKGKQTDIQTAFRIVQIVVTVMNLAVGCLGFTFFFIASSWLRDMVTYGELDTASIILSVLQFCVAIAFCILTLKSLCKRSGGAKSVKHTTSEAAPGEEVQRSAATFCFQHAKLILSQIRSLIVCENTKEDILKNVGNQKPLVPIDSYCMGIKPFILGLVKSLSVCEDMKGTFTDTHTALGVVQIIIGAVKMALWCFGLTLYIWFGPMFLVAGIVCIFAVKFPSHVLLVIAEILNIIGAALSITAVVQLSVELTVMKSSNYYEDCYPPFAYSHFRTISHEEGNNIDACIHYKNFSKDFQGGIHIMMTVLAALQFCVAMSFCALTMKALCKKDGSPKFVEEPQAQKPLMHAEKSYIVV
ncbi:uncharacterized protein LOC130433149 [Triplophysa dalaica]|uniref:uncharacterized protein LOC130433149 n=1 Tax=Triplophysa dalaica TaxID=1582913 RepID=UPI0024DF5B48|nr:uncharacterized protein LOC130433149 [Triplophysa dalaica]